MKDIIKVHQKGLITQLIPRERFIQGIVNLLKIQHEQTKSSTDYWLVAAKLIEEELLNDRQAERS